MKKIMNFFREEDGLELTEYAIMGGLIALATIAVVILLRDQIVGVFQDIVDTLAAARA